MPRMTELSWTLVATLCLSWPALAQDVPRVPQPVVSPSTDEEKRAAEIVAAQTDDERGRLLADKASLTMGLRKALIAQGDRIKLQGDYRQALVAYGVALTVAERIGDRPGVVEALNSLGAIHYDSNHGLGREYYQKALSLSEEIDDKAGTVQSLNNLGRSYIDEGNLGLALEYIQKSLPLHKVLGDQAMFARTLNNIGVVHMSLGNYDTALDYLQKSSRMYQDLRHKVGIAGTKNNIALVYRGQRIFATALEHFQQSLATRQELGDKAAVAQSLLNIGITYHLQGDHDRALEYYQKVMPVYEQLGDKSTLAMTLNEVSLAHSAKGRHQAALEHAERAGALANEVGATWTFFRARHVAGRAHRGLGQLARARLAFDDAIRFIETQRAQGAGSEQQRQRTFEVAVSAFHDIAGVLVSQNNADEALAYAERAKARVILDVLRSGKVDVTKAMTAPEREREQTLRTELVTLNRRISQERQREHPDAARLTELDASLQKARVDYESFQTELYAAHPELRAQRGEAPPFKLEDAAVLLPDAASALLEYVVTEDKTFLFALTNGGGAGKNRVDVKAYTLDIKRSDLADRTEAFRQQVARRDFGFRKSARDLYDLLLGPARGDLVGKSTIVVVPDDVLWDLPFQALQSARNRYLLEDHAISYVPSLTTLREITARRRPSARESAPTLLAFGNPALGRQTVERVRLVHRAAKLEPLPEAETEVTTLRRIYGTERSRIYVGRQAREDRVKAEAGGFGVLHLATHGILNNASPMYSQLVLAQAAGSDKEDGLLEAWEIMNLDLKADLVVLSACETARGRFGVGEGVIGLIWALFVAGSPTTVVSQWKVGSASTTPLMVNFHRNLRNRTATARMSVAGALRSAALTMLRNERTRHPFYWAGFVVVGDGR